MSTETEITEYERKRRVELAAGYRALAEWVETTEMPLSLTPCVAVLNVFPYNDTDLAQLARQIGGKVEKTTVGDSWFVLRRQFGGGVFIDVNFSRSAVCEAVVSEKTVTKELPVDAAEAQRLAEQIAGLQAAVDGLPTAPTEVVEEVTEWQCPPSLLSKAADLSASGVSHG